LPGDSPLSVGLAGPVDVLFLFQKSTPFVETAVIADRRMAPRAIKTKAAPILMTHPL
jgi:hypothetical protein